MQLKRSLTLFIVTLALVPVWCLIISARQAARPSITAEVYDAAGNVSPGVLVNVEDAQGAPVAWGWTDGSGRVTVRVDEGGYVVSTDCRTVAVNVYDSGGTILFRPPPAATPSPTPVATPTPVVQPSPSPTPAKKPCAPGKAKNKGC